MTADEFRAMALALPEASEVGHMGHPDFRVNGKIFATICPEDAWAMVKLTPEQQGHYLRSAPGVFVPAKGAWGRAGATIVTLQRATEAIIREALEAAWQNVKQKTPSRRRAAKK